MNRLELKSFVTESNKIEGISRAPSAKEIGATETFLELPRVKLIHVETFVEMCASACVRKHPGMDVRVGDHRPPPGGPHVVYDLLGLIERANNDDDPFRVHVDYETLHPFMDGNGRSGRVLWAWMMLKQDKWPRLKLGFLHAFYYQALSASRSSENR